MVYTLSLAENHILQKALKNKVHEYVLKHWAEDLQIDCSLNMYISVF